MLPIDYHTSEDQSPGWFSNIDDVLHICTESERYIIYLCEYSSGSVAQLPVLYIFKPKEIREVYRET